MRSSRTMLRVLGILVAWPLPAVQARAWPAEAPELPAAWRGPGGGLAILPAAVWWVCVLLWVRTAKAIASDGRAEIVRGCELESRRCIVA